MNMYRYIHNTSEVSLHQVQLLYHIYETSTLVILITITRAVHQVLYTRYRKQYDI